MSAPNVRNILRMPGRLVKNPTNLAADYPHGGTELGVVRDIVWKIGTKTEDLIAEEFGTPVSVIVTQEIAVVACVLRSWDNDMITSVFRNIQTSVQGDVGIKGAVNGSGINRTGYDMVNKGMKLLFSPIAVDHHRHLLLYNAVPMTDESAELQMSIAEEFGMSLMFKALPDSNGRTLAADLRDNLSL